MKFITPCFVRVEDAGKRERLLTWLQDIGYSLYQSARDQRYPVLCCNMIDDEPGNVYGEYGRGFAASHACDCGTNIELFKALAAMNDENDRGQLFIDEDGHFEQCLHDKADISAWRARYGRYPKKATAQEIVRYFKYSS